MPTKFPDLPPLPDPSLPVKKIAEGFETVKKQLADADEARKRLLESLDDARKRFEQSLRRR